MTRKGVVLRCNWYSYYSLITSELPTHTPLTFTTPIQLHSLHPLPPLNHLIMSDYQPPQLFNCIWNIHHRIFNEDGTINVNDMGEVDGIDMILDDDEQFTLTRMMVEKFDQEPVGKGVAEMLVSQLPRNEPYIQSRRLKCRLTSVTVGKLIRLLDRQFREFLQLYPNASGTFRGFKLLPSGKEVVAELYLRFC